MNIVRTSPLFVRAGVLAIIATLIASSVALAAWSPAVVVRPATFQPTSPDLAASGPNVVAAWGQPAMGGNPASVWVAQSVNNGTTFGTPVRLFKNSANAAQDIAVFSGLGLHFAVWSEQVSGGGSRVFLSKATFGGGWSPAAQVSTNTGSTKARHPRIVVSGNFFVLAYQVSAPSGLYSAYTRVYDGNIGWAGPTLLPGGAPLAKGGVSVAVSATTVLVAWTDAAGTVKERRGKIFAAGMSFLWYAGFPSLGTGKTPLIVLGGTNAVVLWADNADIFRRRSTNAGAGWGPQLKILDGNPGTNVSPGTPYSLYDAAMRNASVAFTVATGPGTPELGQGYRMVSANSGVSWTNTSTSAYAGDSRQLAYTVILGIGKLAEAWIEVDPMAYPWVLKYHRQP